MPQTIPISVVNLARAEQRRVSLAAHLADLDLTADFPEGLDAQVVSHEDLMDGFSVSGPWGPMRSGDIACSQSHRRIWQAFIDSDASHILVLEDDVKLSPGITALCQSKDWWPDGADIVKVERWKSARMKIVLGREIAQVHGVSLRPLVSRHPGAAAYFINRKAAEKLLRLRPQTVAVDHLLFNRLTGTLPRGLRVLQSYPALAHQRDDGVEQMPASTRPDLPFMTKKLQEMSRGLRELFFGFENLFRIAIGRASLVRLPLAHGLEDKT